MGGRSTWISKSGGEAGSRHHEGWRDFRILWIGGECQVEWNGLSFGFYSGLGFAVLALKRLKNHGNMS